MGTKIGNKNRLCTFVIWSTSFGPHLMNLGER